MEVGRAGAPWPFECRELEVVEISAAGFAAVVVAAPGIGKTRLLRELAARAEAAGRPTVRVAGSRSLAQIPLGAFGGTLRDPFDEPTSRFEALQGALNQLLEVGAASELVLVVDDAHHLDDASAGLVLLAARSGVSVLAAVRAGERCPAAVNDLWKDEWACRVDLLPVDRQALVRIVESALGGPLSLRSGRRLWDATRGNLLLARELVRAGVEDGTLIDRRGTWSWDGDPASVPAVRDLVRHRVEGLEPEVRRLVDLIAVGEPLGEAMVLDLVEPAVAERAEREGVVVLEVQRRRREVRLAHPLYAEVIRDGLGRRALAALSSVLADALVRTGCRRDGDVLRVAAFRLDAGGPLTADIVRDATRQAQRVADMQFLERLARAALDQDGDTSAALLLAEVLYWEDRYDEVIALLGGGVLDGATPEQIVDGSMHVANSYLWGKGRLTEAEWWLAWGAERAGHPLNLELTGQHSQMLMVAGRALESISVGRGVLDDPDSSPVARLRAYAGLLSSAAVCGRLEEVNAEVPIAHGLVFAAGVDAAYASGGAITGAFISAIFGGGLVLLDNVFAAMHEASERRVDDPFRGVWAFLRGRSALAQGRLDASARHLREAVGSLRERDPGSMLPWALAALAQLQGMTEDAPGAAATVVELDGVLLPEVRNIEIDVELGRAWSAAARGERSVAQAIADAVARRLLGEGKLAVAGLAFHHVVRLGGDPGRVAGLLTEIGEETGGLVLQAMGAQARGMAAGDLSLLVQSAERFESVGNLLDAAEALAVAASMAGDRGQAARRRDLALHVGELLGRCGHPRTPLLERLLGRGALAALTPREREVVLLAARGMSKRDIAAAFDLSIRTVGNHINHAYAKLGISSRDELRVLVGRAGSEG